MGHEVEETYLGNPYTFRPGDNASDTSILISDTAALLVSGLPTLCANEGWTHVDIDTHASAGTADSPVLGESPSRVSTPRRSVRVVCLRQ